MKILPLLLAATGFYFPAVELFTHPSRGSAPAAVEACQPAGFTPFAARVDGNEAANVAAWRGRFASLLSAAHGNRDQALGSLLSQLGSTYQAWVQAQIVLLADRPELERTNKLEVIDRQVSTGLKLILAALGVEDTRGAVVTTAIADIIAAEIQEAKAAPGPGSRIALR